MRQMENIRNNVVLMALQEILKLLAAASTFRILGQLNRPHRRLHSVEQMQLARLRIAKAREHADGLHSGEAAHYAAHCAQYALRGAIVAIIGVMRIAHETAIARRIILPSGKRADLAVKLADSGADKRDSCGEAQVIHNQARREIVAAINERVHAV
jgi:hypothetical protein